MQGRITLTTLSAQAQEGELKELNLILKADVQGSVEAIAGALKHLKTKCNPPVGCPWRNHGDGY